MNSSAPKYCCNSVLPGRPLHVSLFGHPILQLLMAWCLSKLSMNTASPKPSQTITYGNGSAAGGLGNTKLADIDAARNCVAELPAGKFYYFRCTILLFSSD